MKKSESKTLEDNDLENLIDLVKEFLEFSNNLLKKKIITKEQYLEMTYQKRKFLQQINNEVLENLSVK